MHMTSAIAAAILAFCGSGVLSAPVPQLAGEGSAANSLLSGTDNAVGYGSENALDNTAKLISSVTGSTSSEGTTSGGSAPPPPPPPPPHRRQLAGEGSAANSLLSGTDNAVGYGSENALDNTAKLISSVTGSTSSEGTTSGGSAPPPPPPPPHRRQLDKTSKGVAAVSDALGTGSLTQAVTNEGISADGALTSGAANAGAQLASTEESVVEGTGGALPKTRRQLDKTSKGVAAVSDALGTGSLTQAVTNEGISADGALTSGAANAGAQLASTEESVVEGTGGALPRL